MWDQYLGSLGYTGSLDDKWKQVWAGPGPTLLAEAAEQSQWVDTAHLFVPQKKWDEVKTLLPQRARYTDDMWEDAEVVINQVVQYKMLSVPVHQHDEGLLRETRYIHAFFESQGWTREAAMEHMHVKVENGERPTK